MSSSKRTQRREKICTLAFELLHFLTCLSFEDLVDAMKKDDDVRKDKLRIMRNNLINWMRTDERFSISDAEGGKDVVMKLSPVGRRLADSKTKREKLTLIKGHIPGLIKKAV